MERMITGLKIELGEPMDMVHEDDQVPNHVIPPNDPDFPESEDMNGKRAQWALIAMEAFGQETGQDGDWCELISDFLADLGHLADRMKVSLPLLLERAGGHYMAETQGKGKQFSEDLL